MDGDGQREPELLVAGAGFSGARGSDSGDCSGGKNVLSKLAEKRVSWALYMRIYREITHEDGGSGAQVGRRGDGGSERSKDIEQRAGGGLGDERVVDGPARRRRVVRWGWRGWGQETHGGIDRAKDGGRDNDGAVELGDDVHGDLSRGGVVLGTAQGERDHMEE